MKLIYISSSILLSKTANALHVCKMANSFSKQLREVRLVVRSISNDKNIDIFDYYDVSRDFKIINRNENKSNVFSPILYAFKNLIGFRRFIRKKSSFIYGRDILTLSLISLFSKNVTIELHSIPSGILKKKILQYILGTKKIKKIVVISKSLKKDVMKEFGILSERILISHDGADIHAINMNDNPTKVGYVGSINKGRGIELIFKLAELHHELDFTIIGGDKQDVIEKLGIKSIPKNIELTGYLNQQDIEDKISEIGIVLAPYQKIVSVQKKNSDTSKWMSPIKIFEYMSYGKAIIASDLPVLKEVLVNKKNSLICKYDDVNDWSKKIELLVCDEELRKKIKNNAYNDLKSKFTWDKRAENIIEFIKGE